MPLIDATLVQQLNALQFSQWAHLNVEPVMRQA